MRFISFLRNATPAVAAGLCLAFTTPTNGELHDRIAAPRVLELEMEQSLDVSSKRLVQIERYGWNWVLSNARGTPPQGSGFPPAPPSVTAFGGWNFRRSQPVAADRPGELAMEVGVLSDDLPGGQPVNRIEGLLENGGRLNAQEPLAAQEIFILVPEPRSLTLAALMFSCAAALLFLSKRQPG